MSRSPDGTEKKMFAVIKTGGKQYTVSPEDVIKVEKLEGEAGDTVTFDSVLLVGGEGEAQVGAPLVEGATVAAEIVDQGRGRKIIIFKKAPSSKFPSPQPAIVSISPPSRSPRS